MANMSETIEWHRADEVLPDSDETVLVIESGEPEVFIGYYDGIRWRTGDGFSVDDPLFWAAMPGGPEFEPTDLRSALKDAQEAAELNFEQYQDVGAELCKLAEQRDAFFNALENCRLLAARNRETDLGKWILGVCADVGVTASALRNGDSE